MDISSTQHNSLIVAISGATCTGKTTLSQLLHQDVLHSIVIHQDDYYQDLHQIPIFNGYQAFDDISAINWSKLSTDLSDISTNPQRYCKSCEKMNNILHVIIVEGTQILRNSDIQTKYNMSYFIKLDKATCYQRRRSRKDYASPDTQGFFENHIWPQYCDTERTAFSLTSVKILNGQQTVQQIHHHLLTDITKRINEC